MTNLENLLLIINTIYANHDMQLSATISPNSKLREDLDMDSIMLAELSVRVEDEYGVDVFENGMIYTVDDILSIINKT